MASFGENLRRERELRGVSLREIADATKISVRFLQALENERLDVLPGGLFRKAFVRQYAKQVGLDPERTVAEFLYAFGEDTVTAEPKAERRRSAPQGLLSTLGILLVAGWLVYPRAHGPEVAVPERQTPPPSPPVERVYPPLAATPVAGSARSAPEDGLTLSLSALQDCWVEVTVDGDTVLSRVLAAGEGETLEAHGEIVLSVGNAGGVVFRVNDRPGVPLGKSGEVKKNIVITRQSLPSLVQQDAVSDAPPIG